MDWNTLWNAVENWEWSTIWTAISALATATAVYLIYFAGKQLRFEAWLKAQEVFVEREFTDARTRLFRHVNEIVTWDLEDESAGLLVCRRLDEICHLAPYFAFTRAGGEKAILNAWDEPIGSSWGVLAPLVAAERDQVNSQKQWRGFEDLGTKALGRLSRDQQARLRSVAERLTPQIRSLLLPGRDAPPPAGAA